MAMLQNYRTKLKNTSDAIQSFLEGKIRNSNVERRRLYSDVELLRLDFEEYVAQSDASKETIHEIFGTMDELISKLDLVPISREFHWWDIIDVAFRFISVSAGLVTVGTFCALPMILLRSVDNILLKLRLISPRYQVSELLKRKVCQYMLSVAGITVMVEGLKFKTFEESCVLLTFSHASNLDGYFVSSTCPVRHYALAKKELFLVPFFSWIAFAMGGVPVDRENRDRAINALKRSAEAAMNDNVCIVIAPEGTRSKTGQLLPFKKGHILKLPFYRRYYRTHRMIQHVCYYSMQ